ncbi:MAG: hypothetical protein IPP97_01455 [Candidatus Obscuribacter sp.]|nr:hypothetical protein [Candidatus Obscuribacter sp.]
MWLTGKARIGEFGAIVIASQVSASRLIAIALLAMFLCGAPVRANSRMLQDSGEVPGGYDTKNVQSQNIPPVHLKPPSTNDKRALKLLTEYSICPPGKALFPEHRATLGAGELVQTSWSKHDEQQVKMLASKSPALSILLRSQLRSFRPDTVNDGDLDLFGREITLTNKFSYPEWIYLNSLNINSFIDCFGPNWKSLAEKIAWVADDLWLQIKVADLEADYGVRETREVLSKFLPKELARGRAHQVLTFTLAEGSWHTKLFELKQKLKPLGYDAFALDHLKSRQYFETEEECEAALMSAAKQKLKAVCMEEPPASLVLTPEGQVTDVQGAVLHHTVDVKADLRPLPKFSYNPDSLFPLIHSSPEHIPNPQPRPIWFEALTDKDDRSTGFQFAGYPRNWIPPGALIVPRANGDVSISIPKRFVLRTYVRQCFATRDFDQMRYLMAQQYRCPTARAGRSHFVETRRWQDYRGLEILRATTLDYVGVCTRDDNGHEITDRSKLPVIYFVRGLSEGSHLFLLNEQF